MTFLTRELYLSITRTGSSTQVGTRDFTVPTSELRTLNEEPPFWQSTLAPIWNGEI